MKNMKWQFMLFIAILLIGMFAISFDNLAEAKEKKVYPKVLLQLILRNSDGGLVAYIEGKQITTIKQKWLNPYLDEKPDKKIIIEDGKKLEVIQWQGKTETFKRVHAIAMFVLKVPDEDKWRDALLVNHGAYQVEPGDKISVYWTIIRPAS